MLCESADSGYDGNRVKGIAIFSHDPAWAVRLADTLKVEQPVTVLNSILADIEAELVIIDAASIEKEVSLIELFANKQTRFLVVGSSWPEHRQIDVLVHGAAGYCDEMESLGVLSKAIETVLKGDIWIQRSLVPKVIGALVKISHVQTAKQPIELPRQLEILDTLSVREREVADMIRQGDCNKRIAKVLGISERTVKAHLSSIFKKLNVEDRLNLAILLKSQGS